MFVCALLLSVHIKSVVEQGLSTNLHSTTKRLKHSSNLEFVENVRSSNVVEFEFELRVEKGLTHHMSDCALRYVWCRRIPVATHIVYA